MGRGIRDLHLPRFNVRSEVMVFECNAINSWGKFYPIYSFTKNFYNFFETIPSSRRSVRIQDYSHMTQNKSLGRLELESSQIASARELVPASSQIAHARELAHAIRI